jgi:hypothetical protein
VRHAKGCDDWVNEWMLIASRLRLTGVCDMGKLRTIVSPGGSIASWLPELGSSLSSSPASILLELGTWMVVVLAVPDLTAVILSSVASCASPSISSLAPPGCWLETGRRWCLPPIPIDSCQDIAVVGVNPTTHPTPPGFCVSSGGVGCGVWLGMGTSLAKRPFLGLPLISSIMVKVLAGCSTESALNLSMSSLSLLTVVWMADLCLPRPDEHVQFIGIDVNVWGTSDDVEADVRAAPECRCIVLVWSVVPEVI